MVETRKILWIEDSAYTLRSLIRPLEKKGYRFTIATNEKQALDILDNDTFDLILFDIIIPTGSDESEDFIEYVGVRLAKEIVNIRKITTPIIVISVVNNPNIIKEFESLNVAKILQKGYILPSILEREVENIFKKIS